MSDDRAAYLAGLKKGDEVAIVCGDSLYCGWVTAVNNQHGGTIRVIDEHDGSENFRRDNGRSRTKNPHYSRPRNEIVSPQEADAFRARERSNLIEDLQRRIATLKGSVVDLEKWLRLTGRDEDAKRVASWIDDARAEGEW